MKTKKKRLCLNQMKEEMNLLEENVLCAIIGGGNGTYWNPYSWNEVDCMLDSGHWNGGYVNNNGNVFYMQAVSQVVVYGTYTGGGSSNNMFNVYDTISYLINNAQASSSGYCAQYVRMALQSGGFNSGGGHAWEYDSNLSTRGFSSMAYSNNYQPCVGDIAVFGIISGHAYGHIQMWSGSEWISDFFQPGFWPSNNYRNAYNDGLGSVTIYRQ